MRVIAAPGIRVAREEKPRDYITDTPPEGETGFVVPDSAYYLRRLADGDLIDLDAQGDEKPAASVAAKAKKGA